MALSKGRASLQEIIDAAILAVQPLFESKGFYLETEVPPDLPPVFCDSTRIRQVVINLLSNAGRFTEQGGVLIHVERQENTVVVSVSDTGPGIAPEERQKIFAPFQQLDGSIRRRHSGSGLGLSISKRFVEMHDGKMWLESEMGVGTTIYFSLPLEAPLSAIGAGSAQRWFSPYQQYEKRTRRSKAPTSDVVPPRFVLLEEADTLRRLFDRYLDDVEVTSVRDVEGAIRELSQSPAKALVVNAPSFQEMPELVDLPYDTPAVTCWVPGGDEAAQRLGVVRYLVKPVTRETLFATMEGLDGGVKTVLLVDDKPEVLQLFGRMLSAADRDYRVLRATGGQQALDLLRERQPDVMLLDLIMPGMDGFQVLQEKSQDPTICDIPVVIISATDPSGEPIVSDTLTVTHGGGLSVRNLLACIQAVSEVLSPGAPSAQSDPERPEIPAA
jgi:CheY-like chemotaxis protein